MKWRQSDETNSFSNNLDRGSCSSCYTTTSFSAPEIEIVYFGFIFIRIEVLFLNSELEFLLSMPVHFDLVQCDLVPIKLCWSFDVLTLHFFETWKLELTWRLSIWFDRWIDSWVTAWFDDNKEKGRNQYHRSHCDKAEHQVHEEHSKQQKWLKRIF